MLGSWRTGVAVPAALAVSKGQNAPAACGKTSPIPATARTTERRTPKALLVPYAFLALGFDEEAEGFLEDKIGKAGERQRVRE
jgi:hypothetical protein